jgi:hypothetical protein
MISWPMILKFGIGGDINSKQLLLITFCHICHIKGGHFTLEKKIFFLKFPRHT